MAEKRYQVFISSTFNDLQSERLAVWQNLTDLNYIVAGMERFPSSSDEPFEYIKPLIELSDFFVLVIGSRYGSAPDPMASSYTEMEFDYAVANGIPVLVFPMEEAALRRKNTGDIDQEKRERLEAFTARACKGRLVRYWRDEATLASAVAQSVLFEEKRKPRPGWIRDKDVDLSNILIDNQALRERIDQLEFKTSEQEDVAVDEMVEKLSEKVRVVASYKPLVSDDQKSDNFFSVYVPLQRIVNIESVFDDLSYDSFRQSLQIVVGSLAKDHPSHEDGRIYTVSHLDVERILLPLRRLGIIAFGINDSKSDIVKGRNWLVAHEAAKRD